MRERESGADLGTDGLVTEGGKLGKHGQESCCPSPTPGLNELRRRWWAPHVRIVE